MNDHRFVNEDARLPWRTALLSLVPLLLAGPVLMLVSYHPGVDPLYVTPISQIYAGVTILALLAALAAGARAGFPRWSYVYVGYGVVLLTFGLTYLDNGTPWDINHEPVMPLLAAMLWALLAAVIPALRPFYANLRRDWTLLSYALYAPTLLLLATQDHDAAPTLTLAALLPPLIGVLGALVYLRLPGSWPRLGALLAAMLLGLSIWVLPLAGGFAGLSQALPLLLGACAILGALLLLPSLIYEIAARLRRPAIS